MEVISLAILGILIVISPGADFVLVLKNSLNAGRKAGLLTAAGISLAITIHISYSWLGISYLVSQNQWLFMGIKYAGAAYLIYLGIKGILSASADAALSYSAEQPLAAHRYLLQGFLCNALNPKTMLFFLSIFSQVISADGSTDMEALLYGVYMIALHGIWFSLVATLITAPLLQKRLLGMKKRLNQACGAGLMLFGAALAVKA
ncbi:MULTISPECIES: LysE family transporter [unclassified Vibrio]|uniref:LysE family transporter n=1 Tax=unclassified Vibrio TaxID=2614977 RepID=UPI001360DF88|nr:LysE family transporter [Vibrio sp. V36_P2S2PM302]NAX26879.1 LysE family transporter [Vibrio sp. V38_P2S17PM301]NAX29250.1 LysE family transporter [Vibrio sp. V37_P2S8PM304]